MTSFEKCNRVSKKFGAMSAALASTLLLVACLAAVFPPQAAPSASPTADPQSFVGIWQAKFEGKVFQIVILELRNGKLTGSVSRAHVEVNDDGGMTAAELKEGSDPIIDAKLDAKVLRLTTTDQADGHVSPTNRDTVTFEMTLTGKDEATMIPVDDEIKKEMPKFKPWKLERLKK